ncbi:HD domain-containing phosphohydrolase [Marinitoga aeolica]|uniref:HD domain-containing protein n=1 Tax=Marinitoga aeolica TaxID=2809031 RepID=A0ABY8PS63_9BACT|nr:HD domain-containing phosphohydrolase [Marinitoga aeolica]WGS65458.1 HD domain-containing protein [Marinitoga aeolica]
MKKYSLIKVFNKQSIILLGLVFLFLYPITIYFNIRDEISYKKNIYNKISNIFFTEITKEIDSVLVRTKKVIIEIPPQEILNSIKEVGAFGGYSIIRDKELLNYSIEKNKIILKKIFLPTIIREVLRKINFEGNYIMVSLKKEIICSNENNMRNIDFRNIKLINKSIIKLNDKYYYVRFNDSTYSVYPIYMLMDLDLNLINYILKSSVQWIIVVGIIFIISFWIDKRYYIKIQNSIEKFSIDVEKIGNKILKGEETNYIISSTGIKEIDNIGKTLDDMFKNNIEYIEKNKVLIQEIISLLGNISEFRDEITGNHIVRVGKVAKIIASKIFKDEKIIKEYYYAAQMHDIGKIGIPDRILLKPGKLTEEEYEQMKEHTKIGYKILKKIDDEFFDLAARIALYHHEKFNGTGYPYGLEGKEIPIEGRIVAVCDVFDALISERPYKKGFSISEAIKIIKEESGKHFDPEIVQIFLENIEEIKSYYKEM